ncbi:MAG: GNAT family N-acetyltransferase [Dehalococcoidia bacterium]|nr:MAG: GNAT family N-acetyltransferase [Dehalococcoidia bacterium]
MHGVGTELMRSAEQAARERGHATIGLSVGVDNTRARALYLRLGYRQADIPPFDVRWINRDERGVERVESETCTYFTRRLLR